MKGKEGLWVGLDGEIGRYGRDEDGVEGDDNVQSFETKKFFRYFLKVFNWVLADSQNRLSRNKWAKQEIQRMKLSQLSDTRNQILDIKIKLYEQVIKNPKLLGSLK